MVRHDRYMNRNCTTLNKCLMITGFLTCSWGLIIFCKFFLDQWNVQHERFWMQFSGPQKYLLTYGSSLKHVGTFTPYGAKMSCTSNLLSAITESPRSQSYGIVLRSMICLSPVEPPYAGDTYEQSPPSVMPTKNFHCITIFIPAVCRLLCFWQFGFLGHH